MTLIPTGPLDDLPQSVHETYEDAIREAARLVGRLYLDSGNIPHAWAYFRMLGEPQPVAQAMEGHTPSEDEDIQQLIEIAYHQAVTPRKDSTGSSSDTVSATPLPRPEAPSRL